MFGHFYDSERLNIIPLEHDDRHNRRLSIKGKHHNVVHEGFSTVNDQVPLCQADALPPGIATFPGNQLAVHKYFNDSALPDKRWPVRD